MNKEIEKDMNNNKEPEIEKQGWLKNKTTRRAFLTTAGSAGIATTLGLSRFKSSSPDLLEESQNRQNTSGVEAVTLKVNGEIHNLKVDPRTTLLDCLRNEIHLTGTKKGCDHGQCGACTVHVNGRRVNSCLSFAVMHNGDEITTIEGLGSMDKMHPMQAAFVETDGYQCGYCTAGQIMSAIAMASEKCGPSDDDVKEAMSGNICRCGAYENIVEAIQNVRGHGKGESA